MVQNTQRRLLEIVAHNPSLINADSDRPNEAIDWLEGRVRQLLQLAQGIASGGDSVCADIFDLVEVRSCDIGLEQRDTVVVLGGKGVWWDEHLLFSLL